MGPREVARGNSYSSIIFSFHDLRTPRQTLGKTLGCDA